MPLSDTERHVREAQGFLTKKDLEKADASLKSAEDGIQFISTVSSFPVVQAKKSLLQAIRNCTTGRLEAARADLREAKATWKRLPRLQMKRQRRNPRNR